MPRYYSLKSKLSLTTGFVALLTVALISFLSNFFINQKFQEYIEKEQNQRTKELVSTLSQQYSSITNSWNYNFIHTIGMYALYDGYIIQVFDNTNQSIWDAQSHDMSACAQVMNDINQRMQKKYPAMNGEFMMERFPLEQNGLQVGSVEISFYGPFFLNENDFRFLDALNTILAVVGIFSLIFSVVTGRLMANRVSRPILKTATVAKHMADGDYAKRIVEQTDTTELNQLIDSINHLAQSLDQQETLRKQLTADVAHELRTPLTTMSTHIEAIIDGIWEPTTQRLKSFQEEITRINKLVFDLENLAKVESGNLQLNKVPTNLLELVEKAVSGYQPEYAKKNLTVTLNGGKTILLADQDRMYQVVINLLSNAIKYTPEGGTIEIWLDETSHCTTLSVKDTGDGISKEDLPFVFERFYRADKSRNRTTGGSGIGLAIVKSIVTAHGGTVEVESQEKTGSIFRVVLPK